MNNIKNKNKIKNNSNDNNKDNINNNHQNNINNKDSNNNNNKDEILNQTLQYITKSSKQLKQLSNITKDNTNQYPLLDNLTEEYIQAEHLYDRTPKILKMLDSIDLTEMIISTEVGQDIINLEYELEHLIETTKDRSGNINIYFKRFEQEHFSKDKDNEFYKELNTYNNQVIESLDKLESIFETGKKIVKEVVDINKKKLKNSNNIIKGYLNIGVTLFIIIISAIIYNYISVSSTTKSTTTATNS